MAVIEQIDVRIAFKIVEALSVFRKNFHCAETAFSVAGLNGALCRIGVLAAYDADGTVMKFLKHGSLRCFGRQGRLFRGKEPLGKYVIQAC